VKKDARDVAGSAHGKMRNAYQSIFGNTKR
jgi:hypothetical protein